jgi:hypothetical protein
MRTGSYALIGLGIVIILLAAVNHWVIKANPVVHTTTIIGAVGLIVAVIGAGMMMMGSRSAS